MKLEKDIVKQKDTMNLVEDKKTTKTRVEPTKIVDNIEKI